MTKQIQVGDTVAYSADFLRSTCQFTGPVPFARGVVMSIVDDWLAVIFWQKELTGTGRVNIANLARVDDPMGMYAL